MVFYIYRRWQPHEKKTSLRFGYYSHYIGCVEYSITVFVLQNIAFNERLRAQAKLIQLTKINVLQPRLSLLYATNGDKSLMFDGITATVDDQEICVSIQGRHLKVPLLVK